MQSFLVEIRKYTSHVKKWEKGVLMQECLDGIALKYFEEEMAEHTAEWGKDEDGDGSTPFWYECDVLELSLWKNSSYASLYMSRDHRKNMIDKMGSIRNREMTVEIIRTLGRQIAATVLLENKKASYNKLEEACSQVTSSYQGPHKMLVALNSSDRWVRAAIYLNVARFNELWSTKLEQKLVSAVTDMCEKKVGAGFLMMIKKDMGLRGILGLLESDVWSNEVQTSVKSEDKWVPKGRCKWCHKDHFWKSSNCWSNPSHPRNMKVNVNGEESTSRRGDQDKPKPEM